MAEKAEPHLTVEDNRPTTLDIAFCSSERLWNGISDHHIGTQRLRDQSWTRKACARGKQCDGRPL